MSDFKSFIISISIKLNPCIHNKIKHEIQVGTMHLELQSTTKKFIIFLHETGFNSEKGIEKKNGV